MHSNTPACPRPQPRSLNSAFFSLLLISPLLALVSMLATGVAARDDESVAAADTGNTVQVEVPLHLDYPLLEELLRSQMFTDTGASREILNDPSGCSEILLSDPQLGAESSELDLLANLNARIGFGSAGSCATMLTWRGRIGIRGVPEIRHDGTALAFMPREVRLLDQSGYRVDNPNLQSLAEDSVREVLDGFVVDLKPQLQSVGTLLPEVLPRHSREQIQDLLDTLRLVRLQINDDAVDADIAFTIEQLDEPLEPERALTDEELALWEERWQLMDSLLVLTVKHYAASTQLQELRDALLEALIESRYRLRDVLADTPDTESDAVREWFLQSWQNLIPVIRSIGLEQTGQEHLLLLSVITASDALEALDQLGPNVGLDISADGLRRLARMVNGEAGDDLLKYSVDVDPELRRLLEESIAAPMEPTAWQFDWSFFPKAHANNPDRLNSWVPKRRDLPEYLPMVGVLLNDSAIAASEHRKLDDDFRELYRRVVLTTAWQESCWRHYTVSDDRKLVPVRSGTGDVGLMQINERVWRGFYDQQKLRWDIQYNVEAGAEVLMDYLVKYAIRKGEHKQAGGITNLARASYSAYNGGPSKLRRYRSDNASSYGKKVDRLFWEKYQQVASGNELAVSSCLGGNLSGPVVAAASTSSSKPENYTLQLGAFSSEQAAKAFIGERSLGAAARVRLRGNRSSGQYLVLYGNYDSREQAESVKGTLAGIDAWIRQNADL